MSHFIKRGALSRRIVIFSAILLCTVGSIIVLLTAFHARSIKGKVRPELSLRSPEGVPFQLGLPYGRHHVLVFFSVTCPFCRVELEHVRRLRPMLNECDIMLISVGPTVSVQSFLDSTRLTFPALLMNPADAYIQLGIRNIPAILLVNERDIIEHVAVGSRSFIEDSLMLADFCRERAPEPSALGSSGGGWVADAFWLRPRWLIPKLESVERSLSAR